MTNEELRLSAASSYLWRDRSLYIGHILPDICFTTQSSGFAVFLDAPATITHHTTGLKVDAWSVLVKPDQNITINAHKGRVAALFLDPIGCEYRHLKKFMKLTFGSLLLGFVEEQHLIQEFKAVLDQRTDQMMVRTWLDSWLCREKELGTQELKMLAIIKQIKQHTSENMSCLKIAEDFNMSEVQLMRAFKKCVGIPLRRYRFWHRLSVASDYWLRNQCTMADAAISAGFSDSAHFNRCFKKSLGMPPGFLLGLDRQVNVYSGKPHISLSKYAGII